MPHSLQNFNFCSIKDKNKNGTHLHCAFSFSSLLLFPLTCWVETVQFGGRIGVVVDSCPCPIHWHAMHVPPSQPCVTIPLHALFVFLCSFFPSPPLLHTAIFPFPSSPPRGGAAGLSLSHLSSVGEEGGRGQGEGRKGMSTSHTCISSLLTFLILLPSTFFLPCIIVMTVGTVIGFVVDGGMAAFCLTSLPSLPTYTLPPWQHDWLFCISQHF